MALGTLPPRSLTICAASSLSRESRTPVITKTNPDKHPGFPVGISFEPGFFGPDLFKNF